MTINTIMYRECSSVLTRQFSDHNRRPLFQFSRIFRRRSLAADNNERTRFSHGPFHYISLIQIRISSIFCTFSLVFPIEGETSRLFIFFAALFALTKATRWIVSETFSDRTYYILLLLCCVIKLFSIVENRLIDYLCKTSCMLVTANSFDWRIGKILIVIIVISSENSW